VASGMWYTSAVIWAHENDIVNGYGDGRFGPDDDITREQMATILFRYAQFKDYDIAERADLSGYLDAGLVSDWATDAMRWANAEGLITGRTDTTLAPNGNAERGEMAVVLKRFMEVER